MREVWLDCVECGTSDRCRAMELFVARSPDVVDNHQHLCTPCLQAAMLRYEEQCLLQEDLPDE